MLILLISFESHIMLREKYKEIDGHYSIFLLMLVLLMDIWYEKGPTHVKFWKQFYLQFFWKSGKSRINKRLVAFSLKQVHLFTIKSVSSKMKNCNQKTPKGQTVRFGNVAIAKSHYVIREIVLWIFTLWKKFRMSEY